MTALLPVAEAQSRILAAVETLPPETVPLSAAMGRVLAEEARARRTQPPADLSAMDGYAVRSADLASLPMRLAVIESIPAGATPQATITPGQAARIFTGAFVPPGADMIVIQENTTPDSGGVIVREGEIKPGKHIRRAGTDFRESEALLSSGHRLSARDIALLAAMDVSRVAVTRRPKIAVLATGDELVRPGEARGPAQIVAASLDGLLAQIALWGGDPVDLGIARDRAEDIAAAAARAEEADMLITLGGASVGDHDLVRAALGRDGLNLDFWKIAMRPGKPLMFGSFRGRPFLGLPGNPVSALVCSLLFLKPALLKMLGDRSPAHRVGQMPLAKPLPANDQRQDYLRAHIVDGRAIPSPTQDSGELKPLALAEILIVRPPFDPAKALGDPVDILFLENA
jgi:molybdopterin molybdotransferase